MHKRRKFLTACAALTAAGFVLTVAGIALGGMVTGIRLSGKGFEVSAPSLGKKSIQEMENKKITEPFDNIEINLDYADIRIETADTEEPAISYYMDEDMNFKYEVKDRKLTIRQDHSFSVFANNLSWFSFGSSFSGSGKQPSAVVYVPQDTKLDAVRITADSGDVTCSGLETGSLEIAADYGKVEIQNVQTQALDAALESGSLTLEQIKGKTCQITNDYGDIIMDSVSFTDNMKLAVESGDVRCRDASLGDLDLNSSYGNFTGEKMTFRNVEADMESGDCKITEAAFDNWKMEMEYGSVHLTLAEALPEYGYRLKTEYGSITVDGEDLGESYSSLFQEKEKSKTIKINCESGDIRLDPAMP